MARGGLVSLAAVLMLATAYGCGSKDTGYVQLRVAPAAAAASITLYLDGEKLNFARSPSVVLRFPTGKISLKTSDSWTSPALCRIVVRKDRISIVTVMAADRPPHCVCEIRAPESSATDTICA
jgi:hypothetical protein